MQKIRHSPTLILVLGWQSKFAEIIIKMTMYLQSKISTPYHIIIMFIILYVSCSQDPAHSETFGCTDPTALNFDPIANTDDNSCEYVDIVTDIDGNIYNTVVIGDQEWMAENLKVTHFRNGDPIPNITESANWAALTTGSYCKYDNNINDSDEYGNLFNGYALDDERGICPEGWQVPTNADFGELETFLGMSPQDIQNEGWRGTDEGGKLKESGNENWFAPNTGATNESGFNALPAGYRGIDGNFFGLGFNGTFWSSSIIDSSNIWIRKLYYMSSKINRSKANQTSGFSVRCVRPVE